MQQSIENRQVSAETEEVCATEDLAHIGSIQSVGFLLVGDVRTGLLVQLSENAPSALSLSTDRNTCEELIGMHMSSWLGSAWERAVIQTLEGGATKFVPLDTHGMVDSDYWECIASRSDDHCILEFLPSESASRLTLGQLESSLVSLRAASDVQELVEHATEAFREYSGFDRVMFYRFLPDWSGEVTAESVGDGVQRAFVGLRFPAGDIPPQARALYSSSRVRFVADSDAAPVRLFPGTPMGSDQALDLSPCLLRAVSEAHIEYMKSMSVHSSLSVAVHRDGKLWGLIACHHMSARPFNTTILDSVLGASRLIAEVVEAQLEARIEREDREHRLRIVDSLRDYLQAARDHDYSLQSLRATLRGIHEDLGYACVALVSKEGAYFLGEDLSLQQEHPALEQIEDLFDAYFSRDQKNLLELRSLQHTILGDVQLAGLPDIAGLLIYRPPSQGDVLLAFGLPEQIEEVVWAGDPNLVRATRVDDKLVVRPRDSFERWQSLQQGHSRFWNDSDKEAIETLAESITKWFSERERFILEKQMLATRYTDALTGLPNRNFASDFFSNSLALSLTRQRRKSGHGFLVLIDVTNFKGFNEAHGFPRGDQCLRAVACLIAELAPAESRLFRLGSDDFALVVERPGDTVTAAEHRCDKLERELNEAFATGLEIEGTHYDLRIQTGSAIYDVLAGEFGAILKMADVALRAVKKDAPRPHNGEASRLQVPDARDAQKLYETFISERRFRALYDPWVNSARDLTAIHVSAQLQHPDGRLQPVEEVLSELRILRLADETSLYVIDEALEQFSAWEPACSAMQCKICFSLLAEQAISEAFLERLFTLIRQRRVSPERVVLCVPEEVFSIGAASVGQAAMFVTDRGVNFGIDDFKGDLSQLLKTSVSEISVLCLDDSIGEDSQDVLFFRAISAAAQGLGADLVVFDSIRSSIKELEGTETIQYRGAGVDIEQPASEFAKRWLSL